MAAGTRRLGLAPGRDATTGGGAPKVQGRRAGGDTNHDDSNTYERLTANPPTLDRFRHLALLIISIWTPPLAEELLRSRDSEQENNKRLRIRMILVMRIIHVTREITNLPRMHLLLYIRSILDAATGGGALALQGRRAGSA